MGALFVPSFVSSTVHFRRSFAFLFVFLSTTTASLLLLGFRIHRSSAITASSKFVILSLLPSRFLHFYPLLTFNFLLPLLVSLSFSLSLTHTHLFLTCTNTFSLF